jgi:hypothetical protein
MTTDKQELTPPLMRKLDGMDPIYQNSGERIQRSEPSELGCGQSNESRGGRNVLERQLEAKPRGRPLRKTFLASGLACSVPVEPAF